MEQTFPRKMSLTQTFTKKSTDCEKSPLQWPGAQPLASRPGNSRATVDGAGRWFDAARPQLIDATLALLLATSGNPLVIPSLNRDGDLLSDMVLQMFGSIAGSESLVIAVIRRVRTKVEVWSSLA
jgi:hypothetical protein